MSLIIPGALPPPSVATDLLPHLQAACPELILRMERLSAVMTPHAPEEAGCTALEFLQLRDLGYLGTMGHLFGAGLAPLRAGMTHPKEPIWIADLCSVAVGREGAQMAPSDSVHLDAEQADALFDAAQPLWRDSAISVLPLEPGRWRVWLPASAKLNAISPAAVSTLAIADWWPQHDSLRTWRKLLNEVQMIWHDHPVNQQRLERGLSPINSLWLYGGVPGWKPETPQTPVTFYNELMEPFLNGDWAQWIDQLPALSRYLQTRPVEEPLTLVGERRVIELSPLKRRGWQLLLPKRKQNWIRWWTRQK